MRNTECQYPIPSKVSGRKKENKEQNNILTDNEQNCTNYSKLGEGGAITSQNEKNSEMR